MGLRVCSRILSEEPGVPERSIDQVAHEIRIALILEVIAQSQDRLRPEIFGDPFLADREQELRKGKAGGDSQFDRIQQSLVITATCLHLQGAIQVDTEQLRSLEEVAVQVADGPGDTEGTAGIGSSVVTENPWPGIRARRTLQSSRSSA